MAGRDKEGGRSGEQPYGALARRLAEKKAICFDVDGTLTLPLQRASRETVELLLDLAEHKEIFILTGNDFARLDYQVLSELLRAGGAPYLLNRFHVTLLSGAERCCFRDGRWKVTEADHIDEADRKMIVSVVEDATGRVDGIPMPRVEDRMAQITFLACGAGATQEERDWDLNGTRRETMAAYIRKRLEEVLPDKRFNVKVGGPISIDVTLEGVDKASALMKLSDVTGIDISDIAFIGDGLFPGGNDEVVLKAGLELGKDAIRVNGPEETNALIKAMIKECERG